MLDRFQLEAFATVVEMQSFDRAAAVLHITRGAVSQRIKSLEQSMATVLLIRSKPLELTPAGEVLMRHVKALRLLEFDMLTELTPAGGDTRRRIAIAVNPDSLATWLPEALWSLLSEKKAAVEVIVDDEDYTDERLTKGEVVGCISTEPTAASGFHSEFLGAMSYRCYATPDFIRRHFPDGVNANSVLQAAAVLFDRKDSLHSAYLQRRLGFTIGQFPRHYLPAPSTLLEAITRGEGYGLVPESQGAPFVARGVLMELEPREALMVDLYWHHWLNEHELSRDVTQRVLGAARPALCQTQN